MLKNYFDSFLNNDKEIIAIEIRVTNIDTVPVSATIEIRDSLGNFLGNVLIIEELQPNETITDMSKCIVGIGEMLLCNSSGKCSFKIGVSESELKNV